MVRAIVSQKYTGSVTCDDVVITNLSKTFKTPISQDGFFKRAKSLLFPSYKTISAVDNISFTIPKGALVGFIGPNGAGKSTTLKMLSGILTPSGGSATVLGMVPQKSRTLLARRIGVIFGQRQQLWYHLPAQDSFELFGAMYGIAKDELKLRVDEFTRMFDIQSIISTPVRKLSLGERMRCELVAALLHKPEVLFLDEPTIGMDVIAKKRMRQLIRTLNVNHKTTVLLTSHDLDDIEELCSRVIVINHGKIVFDGSVETLRKKIPHKIITFKLHVPARRLPRISGVSVLSHDDVIIRIRVNAATVAHVINAYLRTCVVDDLSIEEPEIEEVVERLYRQ